MAIALMTTMATLALGPGQALFGGKFYEPLDETLRRAVREARVQAVSRASPVTLEWDRDAYSLVIRTEEGTEILRLDSEAGSANDDIVFKRIRPWERPEVPGDNPDLDECDKLRFDPDRGCTPFIAQIHYAGENTTLRYDPLSNLRLEAPGQ